MAQGLGHVFFLLGHVVEICAVATTIFGSLIVASNERHTKEQLWEQGGGHISCFVHQNCTSPPRLGQTPAQEDARVPSPAKRAKFTKL